MPDGLAPAPREHGWTGVLLALAAFLLLPPTAPFSAVLPVVDTAVLLVPMLAACFLVGWRSGGRLSLAAMWVALAAWLLSAPWGMGRAGQPGGVAYHDLTAAWALLTAGMFGVVSLMAPERRLFARALSAVGLALLAAVVLLLLAEQRPESAQHVFVTQFARRYEQTRALLETPSMRTAMSQNVALREQFQQSLRDMQSLSRFAAPLYPALLALQSLATCALAWSLYHRLSRARIGPPLAALRQFRFNDQLIWGLVLGLVIALLPTLAPLRALGFNLLLLFGVLYALRGLGVIAWALPRGRGAARTVAIMTAAFVVLLTSGVAVVGVGIFDTWLNWRERPRPTS